MVNKNTSSDKNKEKINYSKRWGMGAILFCFDTFENIN